jgi:cbb3-type cytochrome oxidase subunit 1
MYLWGFSNFIIFSEGRILTSQNSEYAQETNSSELMISVMWCCVAVLVVPDVSKERSVFIFKGERVHEE